MSVAGRFALDCAQGLRYLHEHKPTEVVHRDLKPNNLLIDASGHCKVRNLALPQRWHRTSNGTHAADSM